MQFSRKLVFLAALSLCVACSDEPQLTGIVQASRSPSLPADVIPLMASVEVEDGPQAMRTLLAEIAAESIETNEYTGESSARPYREYVAKDMYASMPAVEVRVLRTLAGHELRLGNTEDGLAELQDAWQMVQELSPEAHPDDLNQTQFELAVACLRSGENSNCVARHTSESCILPIGEEGVHLDQVGSRAGIAHLTELLARRPDHTVAQWLLNIAYMTVGEYPEGVPEAYRVDPSTFDSEEPFLKFIDVAAGAGVDHRDLMGGVVIDDFDGDGIFDIIVSSNDPTSGLRYFAGTGDGNFTERSQEAGFEGLLGGANLVQADYDNDGALDLLVLRGAWLGYRGRHPKSLLRNEGDGTFSDVTFEAGLGRVHYPSQSADWADYDNDGDLDLFVGNEAAEEFIYVCELFRNEGDGTFTDVAREAGVRNGGFSKGVAWGDFDNDGWQDLFVSNYNQSNRLYRNLGDGTFADLATESGVIAPWSSFSVVAADFDEDGILDLFVGATTPLHKGLAHGGPFTDELEPLGNTIKSMLDLPNEGEPGRLYRGLGDMRFEDVTEAWGLDRVLLSASLGLGDADGDGYQDLYIGMAYPGYEGLMPNMMFRNREGSSFVDVTTAGGLGHLQKAGAIAFADIDADGDQDIFVNTGGMYGGDQFGDALFANPGSGAHWLDIHLVGTRSNRSAIGARLKIDVQEDGEVRTIHRTIGSGRSYGAGPLRQWVGLGDATQADRIEITWPATGMTQVLENVSADQRLEVVEAAS